MASAVAVAAVALLPIVYLVERAWSRGAGAVADEIFQEGTFELVLRSVVLAAAVTGACVVMGVLAAYLVTRTDLPGRRVWRVALALPLAVPSYVAAFAWVSARPSMHGLGGASLVLILTSYPYVYLTVLAALSRSDPAQEEVARSLGYSPRAVFVRVTLRQVRPAITTGALLVALYVLSDFGAVGIMRYEAFTWVIYGAYNAGFNPVRAAVLSLVLLALALVLVGGELPTRGRATSPVGSGVARGSEPARLGRWNWLATGFVVAVAAAALAFPMASLARWLVRSVGDDVDFGAVASALGASLRFSIAAAILTTVAAIPVGVLAARFRTRTAVVVERSAYVAHALPGIVIAVAMVFVGVRLMRPVYQETPLLLLAYAVLFLPLAVGAVRTAIEQTPIGMEEVARSLGRSPVGAFMAVTARLASPGVAAGAALVFLATMKELPATLLLHPTGVDTLAMGLWQRTTVSDFGGAAPYGAALVLFAAAPTAVLGWWSGRIGDFANR